MTRERRNLPILIALAILSLAQGHQLRSLSNINTIIETSNNRNIRRLSFQKEPSPSFLLIARGGYSESEYDSEDESASEYDEEYDDETSEESSDEYETESESEDEIVSQAKSLSSSVKAKASKTSEVVECDEPLSLSSLQDMGVTLAVMLLCNKLDLTNTKIIKYARFAFIAYLVLVQIFIFYVRFKANAVDDDTPITITNPLSNLIPNSGDDNTGGDMVKSIANQFLASETTVKEYDLSQAKSMNNSLLMPMAMLWFLHFKMGQVQPLFFQTANGIKDFIFSPLFQVYVLGRNLERPFKNKRLEEMRKQQEMMNDSNDDEDDDEVSQNDEVAEDYEVDEDDESSEYDDDSGSEEDEESSDDEDYSSDEDEYDDEYDEED